MSPLWVNNLDYGSIGGGFYWDPASGQVWTGERGWHWFAPTPVIFPDTDRDGVLDVFDSCAAIPGVAEEQGCPALQPGSGTCLVVGLTGLNPFDPSPFPPYVTSKPDPEESAQAAESINANSGVKRLLEDTKDEYVGTYHMWRHYQWTAALQDASQQASQGRRIVLVGHSAGGAAALNIAEQLQREGIPVALLIELDTFTGGRDDQPSSVRFISDAAPDWVTRNDHPAPANVLAAVNAFQRQSLYYHGRAQSWFKSGVGLNLLVPDGHGAVPDAMVGNHEVAMAFRAACASSPATSRDIKFRGTVLATDEHPDQAYPYLSYRFLNVRVSEVLEGSTTGFHMPSSGVLRVYVHPTVGCDGSPIHHAVVGDDVEVYGTNNDGTVDPCQTFLQNPPSPYYLRVLSSAPVANAFQWYQDGTPSGSSQSACNKAAPIPPNGPGLTGICVTYTLKMGSGSHSVRYLLTRGSTTVYDRTWTISTAAGSWTQAFQTATAPGSYHLTVYVDGMRAGDSDVTVPSGSGTDSSGVEAHQCSEEGAIRTVAGVTTSSITFTNESTSTRYIYWLDYSGARRLWHTLQGGSSYVQGTYVTHTWLVADTSGLCLGIYVATASAGSVTIH
ncbi:MAG: hypothetical protein AB7T37_02745 [Dehalococcoidia bacterium]